jgi:glycosyltransferase involved in cell wall biosynthesis
VRIGVSLLAFRPGRIGGAETYVRKLLEHLPQHAGSDELVAVMDRDLVASLATPGFTRLVVPSGQAGLVARRVLEAFTPYRARGVSRAIEASRTDVVLFPQQSVFPLRVAVRAVVTVHDLQHLAMPQNFGAFDTMFRARVYPPSLRRADRVIAISSATRRDLVERCAVDPRRVEVVPHGFAPTAEGAAEPWTPGAPYLYYPAASYPHKGHDVLLRTFAALQPRGWARYRLVFTGEKTSHWAKLERLVRELRLDGKVIHLGFVPASEVSRVYAGAEAVVFPTRFEGFGLPVLEAAERRKKVIVSRLPIFDELGVPRRWQIDFEDPDQLAAAFALDGPTEIEKRPWTWSEVARRTIGLLREAAVEPAPARAAW